MSTQQAFQGAAAGSTMGPIGAAVGGIAGAIGLFGDGGSDEAAQEAERNRLATLDWNKKQDPFSAGGNREQYVPRLNELMQGGYGAVRSNPMFQELNNQSMSDVQRAMSAKGYNMSGNEINTLRDTSQKNQMNFFNDQYTRLAELSGASRGGGAVAKGQDPNSVYNQGQDSAQSDINAFGGFMGGLDNIFGDSGFSFDFGSSGGSSSGAPFAKSGYQSAIPGMS